MNENPKLEFFLNWLVNHSLQAGVLVLFVLLVQWIFHRQLTNRWRFALWWVLVLRLVLPFGPESAVSLSNFLRPAFSVAGPRYYAPAETRGAALTPFQPYSFEVAVSAPTGSASTPLVPSVSTPPMQSVPAAPPPAKGPIPPHSLSRDDLLIPGLTGLWFLGILGCCGLVVVQILRFRAKLSTRVRPADSALCELLEKCRIEFRVTRRVELLETEAVTSPALYGLMRLRLLVPPGLAMKFTPRELRYIFLHELAHVKRGDLWLNWLLTALQIIHWFNPLVWFGFARLRADRELACDELALVRAGETTGKSYGETIIKLLEGLNRPASIPGLIGILEENKQMHRRIAMLARFRRPGRWSAWAVLLIAVVAGAALTDAQTRKSSPTASPTKPTTTEVGQAGGSKDRSRPTLTGQVHAKDGSALAATVFISTAAPKSGSSTFCPSCYVDCLKSAKTDAAGNFKIESLNPELTFRILAVARGYRPKFVSKVDPAKKPVTIVLEPIAATDVAPDRSLRGRVVTAKQEPVKGAVVEVEGIQTSDGGGRWGSLPGIDPLAVTDEHGEFLITAKDPFEMMSVKVTARALAPGRFSKLARGLRPHDLMLTEGATLSGRVVHEGKPLADVSVGVSAVERESSVYRGHYEIGTDTNGFFTLVNLPPEVDFYLYGLMNSMRQYGAIPIQRIHTGKDGEATEIGDLRVGPAHRLAGRVVLADNAPLPAKTRLLASRQQAWDSVQLTLGPDGSFETEGVPSEALSLSVTVEGYRVSAQNQSLDLMNMNLIGRVDRDITNLVVLLEKGPDLARNYNLNTPDSEWPQNRPLRGVEGGIDHSRQWKVSGRVTDSDTKQPLATFRVTPGQTDNFERTTWDIAHGVDATNGEYVAYFSKRVNQPLFKVDAEGYLPATATLLSRDATNVDLVLKKGSGPSGVVLSIDGKPAANATVALVGVDQVGFNSKGELTAYWNKSILGQTDTNGRFSFKPEWGIKSIAAASSNGYAMASIESLATNPTIKLEAFGRITGTLKRTSGLGTNEDLDLRFNDLRPFASGVNLANHSLTDSQGRFHFEHVPPGNLQLTYRELLDGPNRGLWTTKPLKEIILKPGQDLEVKIETTDRPKQNDLAKYQSPQPKLVSGVKIEGVVLLPNGTPAAEAEVALQVEGEYLAIGKGAFNAQAAREKGLVVRVGADGQFTLPMYEGAQSVVALNEQGFAQAWLEQLKSNPKITLQAWGRVEGTLRVGHHPGTNEQVVLSEPLRDWSESPVGDQAATNQRPAMLPHLIYDGNAFRTRTDDQGRFTFNFVPPGQQSIARLVPRGAGSYSHSRLGTVDIKPGKTTAVSFGGDGRTIIGKLKFTGGAKLDSARVFASLKTPVSKLMEGMRQLQNDEERNQFYKTNREALVTASKNFRNYLAAISPDGSFRVDEALPGKYEFAIQPGSPDGQSQKLTFYTSTREIIVPEAKNKDDDSEVNVGTVEMKEFTIPSPPPTVK